MNDFKVGQTVKWKSQAGGFSKEKVGKVVFVVRPNEIPAEVLRGTYFKCDSSCISRGHITYLVQVGRRSNLYWPRVQYLKVANG